MVKGDLGSAEGSESEGSFIASGFAPSVEEHACPVKEDVVPEELEVFVEQVGADGLEVISEQVGQADLLFVGQVLGALAQRHIGSRHDQLITLGFQGPSLLRPGLIDGFAEVGHDVEPV